ncbi:hypothetical protein SCA6_011183 [Theobroma cacao]
MHENITTDSNKLIMIVQDDTRSTTFVVLEMMVKKQETSNSESKVANLLMNLEIQYSQLANCLLINELIIT